MKLYIVLHKDGSQTEHYRLVKVKQILKAEPEATAYGYKINSSGEFEPIGEVKRTGINKTLMAGATRQTVASY